MSKTKVFILAKKFNMDVKTVITKLREAGMTVKRRTSLVDVDTACTVLNASKATSISDVAEVVHLDEVRKKKTTKPQKVVRKAKSTNDDWYDKYPWVVRGSVREPTAADRKALGSRCHGKVCTVRCIDTSVERVVNTQDAFQSKRCPDAQKVYMRHRRAERRQSHKA